MDAGQRRVTALFAVEEDTFYMDHTFGGDNQIVVTPIKIVIDHEQDGDDDEREAASVPSVP